MAALFVSWMFLGVSVGSVFASLLVSSSISDLGGKREILNIFITR